MLTIVLIFTMQTLDPVSWNSALHRLGLLRVPIFSTPQIGLNHLVIAQTLHLYWAWSVAFRVSCKGPIGMPFKAYSVTVQSQ